MKISISALEAIYARITTDTILFFDLDGTLVDTNYANFLSYKHAIEDFICKPISLEYKSNIRFNRSTLKMQFPEFNSNALDRIIKTKELLYSTYLPETKLIVSTASILSKYATSNKVMLVSKCRKDRAMETLKFYNLIEKFSQIFCLSNTTDKQHVNKYSLVIHELSILSQNIIVFENEKIEIADAIKAGIPQDNIIEIINL